MLPSECVVWVHATQFWDGITLCMLHQLLFWMFFVSVAYMIIKSGTYINYNLTKGRLKVLQKIFSHVESYFIVSHHILNPFFKRQWSWSWRHIFSCPGHPTVHKMRLRNSKTLGGHNSLDRNELFTFQFQPYVYYITLHRSTGNARKYFINTGVIS